MDHLAIDDDNAETLKSLLAVDKSKLEEVVSLLEGERYLNSPSLLEARVAEVLEWDEAKALVGFCVTFAMIADQRGATLEDVLAATRSALERLGWDRLALERYDAASPTLKRLSGLSVFLLGAKSNSVFRATGQHLHSLKAIVDLRPVFDTPRENVEIFLAITTLTMRLSDENENERFVTTLLDHEDLVKLRDECNSALKKISNMESLSLTGATPIIAYGKKDAS